MTQNDVERILNPKPAKAVTYSEGLQIFRKFYAQPVQCSTVLWVENFTPRKLNGFTIEGQNGEDIQLSQEVLQGAYDSFLKGDGDYVY